MKTYKIGLFGSAGVGKSAITERLCYDRFCKYSSSTIGSVFQKTKLNDKFILDIWDTAGQERYHSLAQIGRAHV